MSSFQAPGDYSLSESVGKRLLTPGGAVAPGVAPELMPVLVLENDRPENMLLSYQRMFGRAANISAGGAGTRASVRLVSVRSDLLITVDYITAQVAYQVGVERGAIGSLPFGVAAAGIPRDTRIAPQGTGPGPTSSASIVTDNTLGAITQLIHAGAANVPFTAPIVIGPGDILVVQAATDASALTAFSLQWRERKQNPSERI